MAEYRWGKTRMWLQQYVFGKAPLVTFLAHLPALWLLTDQTCKHPVATRGWAQPNNIHTFWASNLRGTNRWAEHESKAFINQTLLYTDSDGELNVCVWVGGLMTQLQSPDGVKGFRAWTAGARGTSQPYLMGFLVQVATTQSLSECVSFSSVCLKSAGRKVAPSWSQQVCRNSGGWPAAIANVQTFVSLYTQIITKDIVKLLIRCLGTLRSFGDILLEFQVFPGFSKAIWFGI